MIKSQIYPPVNKLHFVLLNIFPFLYRLAKIHHTRVLIAKEKRCAHEQLVEVRRIKQEITESRMTMSKPEIKSLNKLEKKLEHIRDMKTEKCHLIDGIEDDDLTDIAVLVEKVLNWIIVILKFLFVKSTVFISKYLWKYFSVMFSETYKEVAERLNKRKIRKDLLSRMIVEDEQLEITTV